MVNIPMNEVRGVLRIIAFCSALLGGTSVSILPEEAKLSTPYSTCALILHIDVFVAFDCILAFFSVIFSLQVFIPSLLNHHLEYGFHCQTIRKPPFIVFCISVFLHFVPTFTSSYYHVSALPVLTCQSLYHFLGASATQLISGQTESSP